MQEASFYCFHDLALEVREESGGVGNQLPVLLEGLSWNRTSRFVDRPNLRICVSHSENGFKIPSTGYERFYAEGFSGVESGDDFYLTGDSSFFHLQPARGQGYARLASSFFSKPALIQRNFWSFGLLMLLRPLGIFSLHAAGVAQKGCGLLIIGASGSGKSTLSIGLIRAGWSYLSDDALLLRSTPNGVEALALRKSFYIEAVRSLDYSDLRPNEEVPDTKGGRKCRICIEETYPEQYLQRCIPRLIVLPRIIPQKRSKLATMDHVLALKILLAESGPQLFDKKTMPRHLELLNKLLQQGAVYELEAGIDLYHDPTKLIRLIEKARGKSIEADYG
jgi:hypothetical protein